MQAEELEAQEISMTRKFSELSGVEYDQLLESHQNKCIYKFGNIP